jgi:arsenate reductase
MTKPAVLFLCTHNAGRSQMAMGFFKHLAGERASVYSGGSEPAREVNPAAVAVMAEKGIDIAAEQPTRWAREILEAADVVITMGCGDACPILPGRRYEEWALADPAGLTVDEVRAIRDEIEARAQTLLEQLGVNHGAPHAPTSRKRIKNGLRPRYSSNRFASDKSPPFDPQDFVSKTELPDLLRPQRSK